ncbi:glycoside hydrolase family 9 protein [Natronospora cellulosivora (SeqCode)]
MTTKILILFLVFVFVVSGTIFAEFIVEEYEPGQLLKRTSFEDGIGYPWHVHENPPAWLDFRLEDGVYVVVIIDPNGADGEIWDLQFRYRDNLSLQSGHTYEVSFTVEADRDMEIYPKIGDQYYPYFEDWNPNQNWERINLQANQLYTHNETFTATRTVNLIEFAFYLASAPAGTTIKFHEISLFDPDFPGHPPKTRPYYRDIRVNQLGYMINNRKRATLNVKEEQANTAVNWWLENEYGIELARGKTEPFGYDNDSGDYVHIIDFSHIEIYGSNYKLYADSEPVYGENSLVESYPFDIANDIYDNLVYDSLKYYYYNRSGIPIEMPYAESPEYTRPAGHLPDIMTTSKTETGHWAYNVDLEVDVSGGWYTTGDHGKYLAYGGTSVWKLMNMYERLLYSNDSEEIFADDTMNIPESKDGVPDILNETRWQIEALLKMQVPDGYERAGMAFHRGQDEIWTGLVIYPHEAETIAERVLRPPTTVATLNLAAITALASRLWEDYDPAFAKRCLKAAERAWQAANDNPEIFPPTDFLGPTPDDVQDEFYWAAAELFISTGKDKYRDFIQNSEYYLLVPNYTERHYETYFGEFTNENVQALGTLSLALVPNNLPDCDIYEARQNIIEAANYSINIQKEQGYGPLIKSMEQYVLGHSIDGYPWGSNSHILNSAIIQAYAYDYTGDEIYLNSIIEAFDYIMGRNPMEMAYVTGYGKHHTKNPYHPVYAYSLDTSFPKAPAGILASGPNSAVQDPLVRGSGMVLGEIPAQKTYIDHIESWSTNESCIIYNAPLAWVSSYLSLRATSDYIIPGDVNGDGVVNSIDATILGRYILTMIDEFPIENGFQAADINNDGVINSLDYNLIMQLIFNSDI